MARRGTNLFKRNDALRAIRSARDGGIEPAMIEIVAKDGTIYRVYGENAALTETTTDTGRANAWNEARESCAFEAASAERRPKRCPRPKG